MTDDRIELFLAEHQDERVHSLMELVAVPSISAIRSHADDCRAAAGWIVADLVRVGLENVRMLETGGHPIVVGDWRHADAAPSVLVYTHYDVQPVDPIEEWQSPPFEAVVADGQIRGRGTADSKCHVVMHARAVEALLATRGTLPVNLTLVIEGEEEISSPHFESWLATSNLGRGSHLVVISDSNFFDGNRPALPISLRGMLNVQLDLFGPATDLHSGDFGGTVENPAVALVGLLARLRAPDGRVTLPGFYDDVVDLTPAQRSSLSALPFDEESYRRSLGVTCLAGEPGYTTLERRGARPTLDITGIGAGAQTEGAKNIIPAEAHAKVSCRLVPNQDPVKLYGILREWLLSECPPGVRMEVANLGVNFPFSIAPDHPAVLAAADALAASFGEKALLVHEGGSIAPASILERTLGAPVVLLAFIPPDAHLHAPNEWMSLRNFELGIRTIIGYWDRLAALVWSRPVGARR